MRLLLTLALLILSPLALGAANTVPLSTVEPAPVCKTSRTLQPSAFEVGLSVQLLLPNRLDDFEISLPAYGPVFGIPLGNDTLHVEALYGASTGLSLFIVEAGYRLNVSTPFFSGFLLGGGHYLHYSLNAHPHQFFGVNGGVGLTLPMSQNFSLALTMKVYFQEHAIVTFGGGFNFLL